MTGVRSSLASLMTYMSILSFPQDLLDFILEMILEISSGWTALRVNEDDLLERRRLASSRGSPGLSGKLLLRFLTLFTKKLFMILDSLAGLETISPFSTNLVGGPPDLHPNQFLRFFQVDPLSSEHFCLAFPSAKFPSLSSE